MSIRGDILSELAGALAELYAHEGSIRALATTAGLTLGQISFYPRPIDTWVFVLQEAEAQGRTQVLLDQAKGQYPVAEHLQAAGRAYADWVTAGSTELAEVGRPMAERGPAPRGLLRAPLPPETFAGRTVELHKLTEVLLRSQAAAVSAAVPGMGGVGKTTLGLKLASDLAPHFSGGVVWLEAGYGAGQSDLVDRLARTLGIDLANEPLVEKRAGILWSVLADRGRVFVILDDLWDIDLGRWAGRELLPADRVLFVTSRDVALCRALCNHVQRLDVLPEAEALELLAKLLGPPGRHEGAAKDLVKLLDGHPLALEIAARRCDNGVDDLPWLVRKLQAGPTLGELKLPGQESRDTSVEVSLAVSYGDLDPDLQQRFRALGAFAPAPFGLNALAAVWNADLERQDSISFRQFLHRVRTALTSPQGTEIEHDAANIARQFTRQGLLSFDSSSTDDNPVYRQHTLLHAYARALLEQAGELEAVAARHVAYYQVLPGRQAENWQVAESFWEQIEMGWQHAWRAGPDTALSYYYALHAFLTIRSHYTVRIDWMSRLLTLPTAQLPDKDRATILNNIGLVYSDLGDQQQALTYYEQALPLFRQVGDRPGEATTFNNIGGVYSDLGDKQQALTYFEQALSLKRQVGDQSDEATTLTNIGGVYAALGDKQQALAYYEQTLPFFRQMGDRSGEATTLNSIGLVYSDLGDQQQALTYFEQALSLKRQVGDRAGQAVTLNNIGGVYTALGDKQQALAYYEQALPLFRQVGDRAGQAANLNNIGIVYSDLGEKQQALGYYEQALPLFRQVGDRAGEAVTLNNIGTVYSDLGDKQQALAYFEQALPLSRQVGDQSDEATTLNNIGIVYSDLGDKQQALAYYEQALPLFRQVGDRSGEATTLNSIGLVYAALGDQQQALTYFEQALPLSRQVGDQSSEATTLNSIGLVYAALGDQQQALAYYEQALPLFRQVGDRSGEATTLNNIGGVYAALGDQQQALTYFEQALSLYRQVDNRSGEATTLNNIGGVYNDLGDQLQALVHYEQNLFLFRQVDNHWGESVTRYNMAMIYRSLNRLDEAEAQLTQVVALDETIGHPDLESNRAMLEKVRTARRAQAPGP